MTVFITKVFEISQLVKKKCFVTRFFLCNCRSLCASTRAKWVPGDGSLTIFFCWTFLSNVCSMILEDVLNVAIQLIKVPLVTDFKAPQEEELHKLWWFNCQYSSISHFTKRCPVWRTTKVQTTSEMSVPWFRLCVCC